MTDNLNGYGLPEAPASLNFTASLHGFPVQITLRDQDEDNLIDRFARLVEILETEYGVKAPGKPGELAFDAEKLVPNVNDGTVYWKIKGGNFQKWGVTVWPEVLRKAGLNPDELDPINGLDLTGWTAVYIVDPEKGHPKKVVELRPPQNANGNGSRPQAVLSDDDAADEQFPVYVGMNRMAFFTAVAEHLHLDAAHAGKILVDTGKYPGGFDLNRDRVQEMWRDLQAAADRVPVA